jgi:hypothetical protein
LQKLCLNKETRKRKEENKIKMEKGPRGTKPAQTGNRPVAQEAFSPNRYPLPSLSLTDLWDPPVITHLRPKSTPEIDPKLPFLLLLILPVSWP